MNPKSLYHVAGTVLGLALFFVGWKMAYGTIGTQDPLSADFERSVRSGYATVILGAIMTVSFSLSLLRNTNDAKNKEEAV